MEITQEAVSLHNFILNTQESVDLVLVLVI